MNHLQLSLSYKPVLFTNSNLCIVDLHSINYCLIYIDYVYFLVGLQGISANRIVSVNFSFSTYYIYKSEKIQE